MKVQDNVCIMVDRKCKIKKWLQKVDSFVAILHNSALLKNVNCEQVDAVFDTSNEINSILSSPGPCRLKDSLLKKYCDVDFRKAADVILEIIMTTPDIECSVSLHAINVYIQHYSQEAFCYMLNNIYFNKKLVTCVSEILVQQCPMNLGLKKLTVSKLLSNLIVSKDNEELEQFVHMMCFKNPVGLILVMHESRQRSHIVRKVTNMLVKHMKNKCNFYTWKEILCAETLPYIKDICECYSNFLKLIYFFLDEYARTVDVTYDSSLTATWIHDTIEFEDFCQILTQLIRICSEDAVQLYINQKIEELDKNSLFWCDVHARLFSAC